MVDHMPDITDRERETVRAVLIDLGEERAAQRLGVGRRALLRIAAGLHVRPGTIALLRLALAREAS